MVFIGRLAEKLEGEIRDFPAGPSILTHLHQPYGTSVLSRSKGASPGVLWRLAGACPRHLSLSNVALRQGQTEYGSRTGKPV
jgi:hypothetical protein